MASSGIPPEATFAETPSQQWLIAFSGGLDSTVLLHWASRFAAADRSIRLRAVHVHHGLNEAADAWAVHCKQVADALTVPLAVRRVQVSRTGGLGLEAAARAVRYAAIESEMRGSETVLLAHHQDDQAETVLLNLARGSGLDGLSGMPRLRKFGTGWIYRPLLGLRRATLEAEARASGLNWIDDPSNRDQSLDRNFLRHSVMPMLDQRWPHFATKAAQAAQHLSQAANELGDRDALLLDSLRRAGGLSTEGLRMQDPTTATRVLRLFIRLAGLPLPGQAVMAQLLNVVCSQRSDAAHEVLWGVAEARRYRDTLYIQPRLPDPAPAWSTSWAGQSPLCLPSGAGELIAGGGGEWQVRFARYSDVIRQPGRPGKTLAKWSQEQGIPPWVRPRLPVVLRGGRICSIGATCLDPSSAPDNLQWNHALAGVPPV